MRFIRCAVLIAGALALSAHAVAGTMFRLEVGHPIAAQGEPKIKNAVVLVRAVVCNDLAGVTITGSAEGIAAGGRRSVPLKLLALRTPGVYAVQRQWPEGRWVLHLQGTCSSPGARASTIVPVTASGFIREKTQVLRAPATAAQVTAALEALVSAP